MSMSNHYNIAYLTSAQMGALEVKLSALQEIMTDSQMERPTDGPGHRGKFHFQYKSRKHCDSAAVTGPNNAENEGDCVLQKHSHRLKYKYICFGKDGTKDGQNGWVEVT